MSDNTLHIETLAIPLPSLAIVVALQLSSVFDPRRGKLLLRREEQLERLEEEPASRREQRFEIDWMRFKEIAKPELLDVLARHGWHYLGQNIRGKTWLLRSPGSRPVVRSHGLLSEGAWSASRPVHSPESMVSTSWTVAGIRRSRGRRSPPRSKAQDGRSSA